MSTQDGIHSTSVSVQGFTSTGSQVSDPNRTLWSLPLVTGVIVSLGLKCEPMLLYVYERQSLGWEEGHSGPSLGDRQERTR